MRNTLSFRAAQYFGLHTDPRRAVPLGDGLAVVIAQRGHRKALAVYEERYGQRGIYKLLTANQKSALIEALRDDLGGTNGAA